MAGPFFDPVHKKYHLFMQARSYNPAPFAPGINWSHFASDDLVTWMDLGTGLVTDGQGCPNQNGCYSGSTVVYQDVPTIVYPGVHAVNQSKSHPDGVGMAQCLARPANLSDPWLRAWKSIIIVPTDPVPGDVNNHFHDDAEPWHSASDGRWYTFASGGNANRTQGVNILYSTTDADFVSSGGGWRLEHALWNISNGQCDFVSCPEMYPLPGVPAGTPRTSGTVVYESLCGCDQYWLGHYNDTAHTFAPYPAYVPPAAGAGSSGRRYCYDYGVGRASKGFWDEASSRRLMWSWITGGKQSPSSTWDGTQTVPRVITLAPPSTPTRRLYPHLQPNPVLPSSSAQHGPPDGQELAINPAREVDALRVGQAVVVLPPTVLPPGGSGTVHDAGSPQLDVLVNLTWPMDGQVDDVSVTVSVLVPIAAPRITHKGRDNDNHHATHGHPVDRPVGESQGGGGGKVPQHQRHPDHLSLRNAASNPNSNPHPHRRPTPSSESTRERRAKGVQQQRQPHEDVDSGCNIVVTMSRASFSFLPNTNIPHGDLTPDDFPLNHSRSWTDREGAAVCATRCDQLAACTCWTYVPASSGGPRCAIKGPGGIGGGPMFPVPGPDVSGYKAGHVPHNLTIDNRTVTAVSACGAATMPGHVTTVEASAHRTSNPFGLDAAVTTVGTMQLRVLVDRSVVEVYDGVAAMSVHHAPASVEAATGVSVTAQTANMTASMTVYRMGNAVVPGP
eukprot:m.62725 g.62725  ORF g.62725 m.62725 type:complete len:728 (+) comp8109_c0_seq1:428-2611(+)